MCGRRVEEDAFADVRDGTQRLGRVYAGDAERRKIRDVAGLHEIVELILLDVGERGAECVVSRCAQAAGQVANRIGAGWRA